jgi:hypothetical protein
MKPVLSAALLFVCCGWLLASEMPVLEGELTVEEIHELLPEYSEAFDKYSPDTAAIGEMTFPEGMEIYVVFGSWCSDSLNHVPAFMKILEAATFPAEHVVYIGVDRQKQDPEGISAPFLIERVPTFVFLVDGREIGRIIENPEESLEKDMLKILQSR